MAVFFHSLQIIVTVAHLLGKVSLEDGRRKVEGGRWKVEGGIWNMEDGRTQVISILRTIKLLNYYTIELRTITWYFTKYSDILNSMTQPTVIVYTATWRAFCHAVKDYLDKQGIKYIDRDVESDPAAGLEAVTKSGQRGIPVVDIDGTIIVGFDRPKIDFALKSHQQA